MQKIWKNLLNVLSLILASGGFILAYLSKKYMGMSRSLAYRHQGYMDGIFASQLLKSQLGVIIVVTAIAFVVHMKFGKGLYKELRAVLFSAGILSALNVVMFNNPPLWAPYVYVGIGIYFIKSIVMFYQSTTIK